MMLISPASTTSPYASPSSRSARCCPPSSAPAPPDDVSVAWQRDHRGGVTGIVCGSVGAAARAVVTGTAAAAAIPLNTHGLLQSIPIRCCIGMIDRILPRMGVGKVVRSFASEAPQTTTLMLLLSFVRSRSPGTRSSSDFDPQQNSRSGCLVFRTAHECSITTQCLRSPAGRIESWRRGAGSRPPTIVRRALR
jgi:hypothetical protein